MEDITTQHHEMTHLFTQMLVFFGIAGILVPLLQRLKITSVLGYLLCGVAIGPHGLGVLAEDIPLLDFLTITDMKTVQILGELGIVAMLFMIGLELSFARLKELKHYVLGLGSLQIIVSACIIFAIALLFNNPPSSALLIGASLALSSTAIVMHMLGEMHLGNRKIGILCFSILLMQDLAVIPIVVLASAFSDKGDQGLIYLLLESLVIASAAIAAIYSIGRLGFRPLWRMVGSTRNPEWFTAFILFIVIASAATTQYAGMSAALGAFLAGLLIAETECSHAVEVIIAPLKSLLLGIFFLSIGMMIDVREIVAEPWLVGLSVLGIFAIKACILFPLCRFFKVPKARAAAASIMLAQPGEFAFLILSIAMASDLIPRSDAQFFLLVTAVAMFFSPMLFKLAPIIAKRLDESAFQIDNLDSVAPDSNQVLIAGFGRIGIQLATILERQNIPYLAIDNDSDRVQQKRKQGYSVLFSDARHERLWEKIGIHQTQAVIVTVDNQDDAEEILRTVRAKCPLLPVIMRAHDMGDTQKLYAQGATHVIPEVQESSRQLARLLLETLGLESETIFDMLQRERREELAYPGGQQS